MIYFIEAVGAERVKIGFTDGTAEARLKGLQTGCPHLLYVRFTIEGNQKDEARLHRLFAEYREQGEWFRIEGALWVFLWSAGQIGNLIERLEVAEQSLSSVNSWMWPVDGERDEDGRLECDMASRAELAELQDAFFGKGAGDSGFDGRLCDLEHRALTDRRLEDNTIERLDSFDSALGTIVRSQLSICEEMDRLRAAVAAGASVEGLRSMGGDCRM